MKKGQPSRPVPKVEASKPIADGARWSSAPANAQLSRQVSLLTGMERENGTELIEPGAYLLRGFAHRNVPALVAEIDRVAAAAPFRNMITPGGFLMSVAMTNCGEFGWVTDRSGYRYVSADLDGRPWPAMPAGFRREHAKTPTARVPDHGPRVVSARRGTALPPPRPPRRDRCARCRRSARSVWGR